MLDYKYADYAALDKERRLKNLNDSKSQSDGLNDQLPKDDGKWEEIKDNKESLAVFNHKKASVHYLETANLIS